MSEPAPFVRCNDCGTGLDVPTTQAPEEREPCPSCGSTRRFIGVGWTESLQLHDDVHLKHKRPGQTKPVVEVWSGASQSADGSWAVRYRRINRADNPPTYTERVELADGTVVRDVMEPLDQHTGRGSAKPKP